jgi:hypothetical protein
MTLWTAHLGLSLRARARRWSITKASAMMLSTVSVVVEGVRQHITWFSVVLAAIAHAETMQPLYQVDMGGGTGSWMDDFAFAFRAWTTISRIGKSFHLLISRFEHVVRTLDSTRTYSRHLTAASWKLW